MEHDRRFSRDPEERGRTKRVGEKEAKKEGVEQRVEGHKQRKVTAGWTHRARRVLDADRSRH